MTNTADNFAAGLARFMHRNNLNLKDVAAWFDINEASVSKWRSGKTTPYIDKVTVLIDKGMRLDEIFGAEIAAKLTSDYQVNQAVENPQGSLERAKQFSLDLNELLKQIESNIKNG